MSGWRGLCCIRRPRPRSPDPHRRGELRRLLRRPEVPAAAAGEEGRSLRGYPSPVRSSGGCSGRSSEDCPDQHYCRVRYGEISAVISTIDFRREDDDEDYDDATNERSSLLTPSDSGYQ